MVGLLGPITAGTGGTSGTYGGVAVTGGSGSGATANITVSGGGVTTVTVLNPGSGYQVGDTLSAASGNIGSTTGFSVQISPVSINQSLAGGFVYFYIPATNTLKQTWTNSTQTVLNQNPVVLDQNGCAVIYGTGMYRQVLTDAIGDIVWDRLTTDTSAQQNTFWAGVATGTPNAITLTDAGFNGTDGSIINFFPLSTNTGAVTISISGSAFTGIPVVKDTTGGPVALTGGEIASGPPQNVVSVIYSSVQGDFHLLNTAIQSASGATSPLCGAVGLKITNGSSPSSVISLTAGQVVMQTSAGLTINRSNVSLTNINISTGTSVSTANGMDGESPGNSNWLYIWAIDNGAAPAGLVSLAGGNGLAPILPSGYTYKCRLGAMRVDGSGNLLRSLQLGPEAQYTVVTASNTAALPLISGGPFGSFWTAFSVAAFVPPTGTKITLQLLTQATAGSGTAQTAVAPNNNYSTTPNTTAFPPCSVYALSASGATAVNASFTCAFVLESSNIFAGQSTTGSGSIGLSNLAAFGWKDNVNAN
jgi:hypothetical protein